MQPHLDPERLQEHQSPDLSGSSPRFSALWSSLLGPSQVSAITLPSDLGQVIALSTPDLCCRATPCVGVKGTCLLSACHSLPLCLHDLWALHTYAGRARARVSEYSNACQGYKAQSVLPAPRSVWSAVGPHAVLAE